MTEEHLNVNNLSCPLPLVQDERIVMGHGSGGKMTHDLIRQLFFSEFDNQILTIGDDAGTFDIPNQQHNYQKQNFHKIAISTDSHVVSPLFFPGGDIGRLAVCGTVNDILMKGAIPEFITAGFILEEGLEMNILTRIVRSMRIAADEAKVKIIAGDTKVVQKGKADGIYINTSGVGFIYYPKPIGGSYAVPGDKIIISGSLGDHGIAVLQARNELNFETEILSDVAPLNALVKNLLNSCKAIHVLRDPTRGGLATSLVEISLQSKVGIEIIENKLPIKTPVRAACEMLGFDPMYIANEGKLIAIVDESDAERALLSMRKSPYGADAQIIGTVLDLPDNDVILKTSFGSTRVLDMLSGELLPRIC